MVLELFLSGYPTTIPLHPQGTGEVSPDTPSVASLRAQSVLELFLSGYLKLPFLQILLYLCVMKGLIVCILMLLSGGGFFGTIPGEPFIIIDKQQLTLTLYDADSTAVKTYRIACSKYYGPKERKGDNKTPEGTFKINQLLNARGLSHDFGDGKGPVRNAYGPWFLRLDVPGFNDIGIHGTHLPESIGSRATEGCIRLTNDDITDLKGHVKVGTVVTILPDETNEQ